MKSYIYALWVLLTVLALPARADVVTYEPMPLQQNSQNVTIYFHADEGSQGLLNSAASTAIYAHTGVITDASKSDSDWKHAPAWSANDDKRKLTYVSPNLWRLDIGNINEFYGIEEGETVQKLAFVFRNAAGSKTGKDEGDKDIFVPVLAEGFQLELKASRNNAVLTAPSHKVTFTLNVTAAADLTLKINGTVIGSEQNVEQLVVPYTFDSYGDFEVDAFATKDGVTLKQSRFYCMPRASQAAAYPSATLKQGGVRLDANNVLFTLAAPEKTSALIVGSWNDFVPTTANVMDYTDVDGQRYFWVKVPGLDPDKVYSYYYIIDGKTNVADPYAKLVLDCYNDKYISEEIYPNMPQIHQAVPSSTMVAIYHENINNYNWKVKDFKGVEPHNLIIYELLFRDFTGTEGAAKGNGTVRQAIEKIPYLKNLGINAVELLPIMEFNGNLSWGYNTNFYFAPDKAYGTPDDYKEFIDKCHENGIAVILDIVFNQSDGLHPWYQMYGNATKSPFYNGTAPHAYSVLNDWNQDHPLVEKQWKDCVQYWLKEYNVDGFRFDLVKGLGDNNSFGSNTDAYNASRVARMKRIHDAIRQVKPDAYFINENLAGAQEENEMAADGQLNWANVNNSACQYAMGYSSESGLNRFQSSKDSRTWGSTVSYAESHDEERMGYKQTQWGITSAVKTDNEVQKARIASVGAQMILAPGAHMIWQFSELGNTQTTKNNSGNDTGNKKVEWSVLDDEYTNGCYQSWCDFGYLRNTYAHLFDQDATYESHVTQSYWAKGRTIYASKGDEEIIVVLNPNYTKGSVITVDGVKFQKNSNSDYKIASKTYGTDPTFDASAKTVTLPANSYVVFVRSNMSGVDNLPAADASGVKVYVKGNDIYVQGNYTNAAAYTLSGARAPMQNLSEGIYLVRVDGQTFKVLVK